MASALDSLSPEQMRNVARLATDPGWLAFKQLSERYMDEKLKWAAASVFTPDGIGEDDRHYWRGYMAGMRTVLDWPHAVQTKLEREKVK